MLVDGTVGILGRMDEKPKHSFTLRRLMLAVAALACCLGAYRALPDYLSDEDEAAIMGMTREQLRARFGESRHGPLEYEDGTAVWCYHKKGYWFKCVRIHFGENGKVDDTWL